MTSDQINNLKKVYWQQKTVPSYYFPNKKNIFKKIQQTFDTKNDIETQDFAIFGSLFDNFGRRNKKVKKDFLIRGQSFTLIWRLNLKFTS